MSNLDFTWFSCLAKRIEQGLDENGCFPTNLAHLYNLVNHPNAKAVKKAQKYERLLPNGKKIEYDGLTTVLNIFFSQGRLPTTGGGKSGGSARGQENDLEMYNLIYKGIIPKSEYALKTCNFLWNKQLQPFASQFIVFDDTLKVATSIDMLCIDLTDKSPQPKIVIIEEKTGFPKNYEREFGRLCSPFYKSSKITALDDSFKNRHQLQILGTELLFKSSFHDVCKRSASRVIVISEDIHSLYSIKSQIRDITHDFVKNLLNRDNKKDIKEEAQKAAALYKQIRQAYCK
jgi:hypothetical protein